MALLNSAEKNFSSNMAWKQQTYKCEIAIYTMVSNLKITDSRSIVFKQDFKECQLIRVGNDVHYLVCLPVSQ